MSLFLSKISRIFLAAGLFVPCLLNSLFYLKLLPIERVPDWVFIALWPAFGFYLSAGYGGVAASIFGFIMSVLANGLAYLLVGAFVSFLHRVLSVRGARGAVQG
jgi:hypothetical protein